MSKHITILVPEADPQLVSIAGTYKAFTWVNQYYLNEGKIAPFDVQLVGLSKRSNLDQGLFSVRPHATINEVANTDLIVIPAINWNFDVSLPANKQFLPWIVKQRAQGAEVASMCVGGFLLALTGLLKGKHCSTHWMGAPLFRKMFPDVHLSVDKIITDENGIYTNGGALSYINLVLYLIEKYTDRNIAVHCAKVLEVDIDRNSQSPFMMFTMLKEHQDEEIKQAQFYMEQHIDEKISIEALSAKLAIGRRNFDRRFIKATAHTPIDYLQRLKIEAAKKALETTKNTINEVMYATGYVDAKSFRDVFKKITGFAPLDYRNKYNKSST